MGTPDDAALGLPLVMTGSDATDRLNEMIGTTPGPVPSRKDAASLSDTQARQRACRVVEQAAHQALLESLTTQEQFTLVRAYNDSIHATRKADLDVHFALWAEGGAA